MTDATEQQRYPIGRHVRSDIDIPSSPEDRAGYLLRLAQQTTTLSALAQAWERGLAASEWAGSPV